MKPRAECRPLKRLLQGVVVLCLVLSGTATPAAARDTGWPSHGLNAAETRNSPLSQITANNLPSLGLAWQADLDSNRGLEGTPIVVDGVMYVSATWSRVTALDARDGTVLWRFDPEIAHTAARNGCCDAVNRGVAVADGRVFLGSYDGRLIALDARNGKTLWVVDTVADPNRPYTITGAPRLVKDMVVIGNGGADYGVRGYVSAYEQKTGKLRWRFFTVPGSAMGPFEHTELETAAKTWDPASPWATGVGGTVWDSMSWDPELDLLYVGTGNGSPWARFVRSPSGGDNLYLSSILAIDPDDGRLVWHYQTTPADSWDYTATQHIILADILWRGSTRKVLFQAPKNGFFYVLDRKTGELLAADQYVRVTWASHVDLATGRPVESATADYRREDRVIFPSTLGGHNWHPMAFNAGTGLVYIPAQEAATHFSPTRFTVLLGGAASTTAEEIVPDDFIGNSVLIGWDPQARAVRWSYPRPMFSNAGVLSTDGGLVVQGDGEGYLNFHDAATGKLLRRIETGTGIVAPPISYAIDGRQYIAVLAGWGGALFGHAERQSAARRYSNAGRIIVLALDGSPVPLPDEVPAVTPRAEGDRLRPLDETAQRGRAVYVAHCGACHSWFGHNGLLPDLRRTAPAVVDELERIVLEGGLEARGMPAFRDTLTAAQVEDLKAYLRAVRLDAPAHRP